MPYATEPTFRHGQLDRSADTAIVLCNLGTPEAPNPAAVRAYLAQFLADPRVVEIPRLAWWLILHGVILRTRPAKSAAKYASVWMPEGSPLKVWTEKQTTLLRGYLGERGHRVSVQYAMRYGTPSIGSVLDRLKADGVHRILVLPMYPQYSATTTASVFDSIYTWARGIRHIPEFRFVNRFHDHPGYISAVAKRIFGHWAQNGRPDKLVMSFHGLPQRNLLLGDPYHCECLKTARLIAQRIGIASDDVVVTFQSRFGKARWLQPYTEPTLIKLAQTGVKRVDVLCPGFVADCLETLEEIAMEARNAFIGAGGESFQYIACLNDLHEWISALSDIIQDNLLGWETRSSPDLGESTAQRERALARGAED